MNDAIKFLPSTFVLNHPPGLLIDADAVNVEEVGLRAGEISARTSIPIR